MRDSTPPPGGRLGELPGRGRPAAEAGEPPLFPEVLRRRAARHGERTALVFLADGEREGARLDYASLAAAVAALAGRIAAAAAPGERALLVHPPGLDFAVAFLACLEAGVVAVPAYPPRRREAEGPGGGRLARLFAEVEPRLLLTVEPLRARLAAILPAASAAGVGWWATDDPAALPAAIAAPLVPDPDAPAFLQFTSGTTGEPRGVVVTHRNLAACEEAIRRAFGQDERSVVVGWLPPHHDMGLVGTLLQPLWCGGTGVLMAPAAFLQRPRRWLEAIGRYRATTTGGPDFGYLHCLRRVPPEERRGLDLSSLAVAFSGAEPVRAETLDAFADGFAPCGFRREAFFPCYGLAEATLFVAGGERAAPPVVREIGDGAGVPPRRRVGCGRAWPGEELRIVDRRRGVALPAGREGEIWVAGPAVAAGYWRRPEETAAAFGARLADGSGPWLSTGDLGVLDAAGELFVTGRAKELVIVRGRNLHPEDVEAAAAAAHPAVVPGGVAAFALEAGGEERLAVVVEIARRREAEAAAAAEAVRAAVLADQDVAPWWVLAVRAGAVPRTTSGKVRRRACREALAAGGLPRLAEAGAGAGEIDEAARREPATTAGGPAEDARQERGHLDRAARPPSTFAAASAAEAELAALVASVASSVAGTSPADLDSPLSLDSLEAVEVRERVARQAGRELALEEMLAGASPRRLAALAVAPAVEPLPPLEPVAAEPGSVHPLSDGQRALWLVERLTPGGAGLHLALAAAVRVEGAAAPEPAAVERAVAAVAARHPALRATFPVAGGEPVQRIAPPPAVDFELAAAPPGPEALAAAAAEPFDLDRGPLVRVRLWPRAGDVVLLLAVHHAVADFWSLEVLLAELAAELSGTPPRLDAESASLAFVHRQRRRLDGAAGRALADWWRRELAGAADTLELPADRPRPPVPSHRGDSVPVPLPDATRAAAAALAGAAGVSPFAVLLAVWQAVLARHSGAAEVTVGCAAAGRPDPELSDAVGHFANLLPLRTRLADDPAFVELARRAGRALAGGLAHQELPFARIVEAAAPRRDPARHPLVQAGLALEATRRRSAPGIAPFVLGQAGGRLEVGPLELVSLPLPRRSVQLDLLLTVVDDGDRLAAGLDFATDLFDRPTAERLARHLANLLAAAAAAPEVRLSRLGILDAAERAQALGYHRVDAEETPRAGRPPTAAIGSEAAPVLPSAAAGAVRRSAPPGTSHAPTVPAAFFAAAERWPEATAVSWRNGGGRIAELSYRDLAAWVAALAARLAAAGVGAETPVGILLGREPARVAAFLAVLAAGGRAVAIEPDEPRERVVRLLSRVGARLLISAGAAAETAPEGPWRRLDPGSPSSSPIRASRTRSPSALVDHGVAGARDACAAPERDAEAIRPASPRPGFGSVPPPATADAAGVASLPAPPPLHPELAAYVVFTSGSTGQPKPVVVPHRAIAALAAAAARDLAVGPGSRVLHLAPLAFDISVAELVLPLVTGGTLCLAGPDDRRTGAALAAAVEAFGATVLITTPTVLSLVPPGRELPSLRSIVLGGEPTPPELAARWAAGRRLLHGYGPAEATVYVSRRRCPAEAPERIRDLGDAVPGSRLALLGRWGEPVPAGAVGEIALAGAALARGYGGDPRATAERFRPDPWSPAPGGRLYLTGDLARRRPGFGLELAGRRDAQLKVRGVRVEPGEVEAALARHPAVARAAVAARGERLVAWWVPANGGPPPAAADLRAFLAAALPAPLLPSRFVAVPALPSTATGKLDRAALVEPPLPAGAAPRGELERLVARLWGEALGIEAIDADATFFDLGGHSLALARVHARLVEELGREVPIAELFSHPTVASLAAHLARDGSGVGGPAPAAPRAHAAARRAGLAALRARPAAERPGPTAGALDE